MNRLLSRLVFLPVVLTLSGWFATTASALEEFQFTDSKTLEVGRAPHIVIEAINGDVSYTGGEGTAATVEIDIVVKAADEKEAADIREHLDLVVDGEAGFLDVGIDNAHDFYEWLRDEYSRRHQVTVSFKVNGPRGAEGSLTSVSGLARVENIAGPIEVTSVSGDVSAIDTDADTRANTTSGAVSVRRAKDLVIAESVSGDVVVADCGGNLEIESTSGAVRASTVKGAVTAETISGDVDLTAIALDVDVETVSGDIWVENEQGNVKASSTSGDITVHTMTGRDVEISSISGSVGLAVRPDGFGSVVLTSPSGEIDSDIPLRVTHKSRSRLEGRLGDGPATLRVSTTSGDIALSEL